MYTICAAIGKACSATCWVYRASSSTAAKPRPVSLDINIIILLLHFAHLILYTSGEERVKRGTGEMREQIQEGSKERRETRGAERRGEERREGQTGKKKNGKKTKRKAKQRWEKDVTPYLCLCLCSCLFGGVRGPTTHA